MRDWFKAFHLNFKTCRKNESLSIRTHIHGKYWSISSWAFLQKPDRIFLVTQSGACIICLAMWMLTPTLYSLQIQPYIYATSYTILTVVPLSAGNILCCINLLKKSLSDTQFCRQAFLLESHSMTRTLKYGDPRKEAWPLTGAARLDGLPGCSPPWKMSGKRFRQTAKLALSLDLVTKISQHNHFRYFRHHFGSTFPRNPTKPMFRCFPTTPLMRWRFQHTCRWIWRFRVCPGTALKERN